MSLDPVERAMSKLDGPEGDGEEKEGHEEASALGEAIHEKNPAAILSAFKALMACCGGGEGEQEPEVEGDDNY